jgi:hypothetical protein
MPPLVAVHGNGLLVVEVVRRVWRVEDMNVLKGEGPAVEVAPVDTDTQIRACDVMDGQVGVKKRLIVESATVHPRVATSEDVIDNRRRSPIGEGQTAVGREAEAG